MRQCSLKIYMLWSQTRNFWAMTCRTPLRVEKAQVLDYNMPDKIRHHYSSWKLFREDGRWREVRVDKKILTFHVFKSNLKPFFLENNKNMDASTLGRETTKEELLLFKFAAWFLFFLLTSLALSTTEPCQLGDFFDCPYRHTGLWVAYSNVPTLNLPRWAAMSDSKWVKPSPNRAKPKTICLNQELGHLKCGYNVSGASAVSYINRNPTVPSLTLCIYWWLTMTQTCSGDIPVRLLLC